MTLIERWRKLVPHAPETIAFVIGTLLRLRLAESYAPAWSYDYTPHIAYLEFVAEHGDAPPLSAHRAAYNPPLYYLLGGAILRRKGTLEDVQLISIVAGIATLALLWLGLRRFLPKDPLARLMALSLGAVLPCAIHIQGMITNEALVGTFATATLLWVRPSFEARGARRLLASLGLGLTFALALIARVSPIVFSFAFAGGLALDAFWNRKLGAAKLARRLAPTAAGVSLGLLLALPVHARHYADTGILFPTGYDSVNTRSVEHVPLWDRRPASYFLAPCAAEILERPFYPSCSSPDARFWPVLVASTFGDYYNYRYAGMPYGEEPYVLANGRPLSQRALWLMRASVAAGALIAFATAIGTAIAATQAIRKRNVTHVVLIATALTALAGQLAFTVRYPFDGWGPIKGSYLQFASAPLLGVFGAVCSWLWRVPRLRVLAWLLIGCVLIVGLYSVYARWHGFV